MFERKKGETPRDEKDDDHNQIDHIMKSRKRKSLMTSIQEIM